MRQHLTAVLAAQTICNAKVQGAELGASEFIFLPREIKGGEYEFAIGTAGSTALVAQSIIPALLHAKTPSTVVISGGTHALAAPVFEFLQQTYVPLLQQMGFKLEISLQRYGFFPAGGGKITIQTKPHQQLYPLHLLHRGTIKQLSAQTVFANIPGNIALREKETIQANMDWPETQVHIKELTRVSSQGNYILFTLEFDNVTHTISTLGEKRVSAEEVAKQACNTALAYLESNVTAGEYLADQLLLPMALVGEGSFTTVEPSLHSHTNMAVIKAFLKRDFQIVEHQGAFKIDLMC